MKEIFEIDLKGNRGGTIEEIVSFSKHVEQYSNDFSSCMGGYDEEEIYELHIKLKNGIEQKIKFRMYFELFREQSCFNGEVLEFFQMNGDKSHPRYYKKGIGAI